jgi:hypothetical protein
MTVASTQAEIRVPMGAVWRWRLVLVALAFIFAAIDFAIVAVVQLYPESPFGATYLRLWGRVSPSSSVSRLRTTASRSFHRFSSSAATRRLSGSTASYWRRARLTS